METLEAERLAQIAAEKIFNRLDNLPKGTWVHGEDFLPANVTCDYAGQRGLINLIAAQIKEVLENCSDFSENGK